jgi:hypothetical protein
MTSILALLLACAQAQAQKGPAEPPHRSEEMEYVRTETGFTVPRMAFEGDATLSHLVFDDFRGNNFDLDILTFQLEGAFGITDWIQAEMKVPFLWIEPDPGDDESGIGDIVLEGKTSFRQGLSPVGFVPIDLAGGLRVALPTGDEDEGLGREDPAFGIFAAASYPFIVWLTGHAEFWTEWQSGERPIHGVNVAAEFTPWMRELSLVGALNYSREGTEKAAVSLVPGVEYRLPTPRPQMSIGGGIPIGLTSRAADIGFIADFQIRF